MTDPALPPNLADELAEIKRRLKNVESANRLHSSSVRGGVFKVLDADGAQIAAVGRLSGTTDGFSLASAGGTVGMMHASSTLGWAQPLMNVSSWWRPTEAETITSGTFVDAWRARAEQNLSLHLRFTMYIASDAGTTGEVRVTFGGVAIGDTLTVPGGYGAYREFSAVTNGVLYAGPYNIVIQARRTGGTGNLYLYRPPGAVMGKWDEALPVTGWI